MITKIINIWIRYYQVTLMLAGRIYYFSDAQPSASQRLTALRRHCLKGCDTVPAAGENRRLWIIHNSIVHLCFYNPKIPGWYNGEHFTSFQKYPLPHSSTDAINSLLIALTNFRRADNICLRNPWIIVFAPNSRAAYF